MQTHRDRDAMIQELEERAKKMVEKGESQITAGKPGEEILDEWILDNIRVRKLPDDSVLRISIGGQGILGVTGYCTFRGNHDSCIDLLERALGALKKRGASSAKA